MPIKKLNLGALRALSMALGISCLMSVTTTGAEEESLKEGAKRAGRATGAVVHDIGQGAKQVGKEIGQEAKKVGKAVGEAATEGGKEFRKAVKGN